MCFLRLATGLILKEGKLKLNFVLFCFAQLDLTAKNVLGRKRGPHAHSNNPRSIPAKVFTFLFCKIAYNIERRRSGNFKSS